MPSAKDKLKTRCACYTHACGCPRRDQTNDLFLDNVADVAGAVAEVLQICGIHPAKAKGAIEVIVFAFMHYDDIRQRIDTVPRKRLCKTDVIHALSFKCLMTRLEAQLTYSILKRAFKAFYHGTDEGGLPNPLLEAQLIHTQKCMWVHAAKRSAQIFASYEGMFFMALKDYEARIRCVYKHLYDRMQARSDPAELEHCICPGCNRRLSANYQVPTEYGPAWQMDPSQPGGECKDCDTGQQRRSTNEMVQFEQPKHKASNVSIHLPRCKKCKCPDLICDCSLDRQTYSLRGNYSQGPFKCIWFGRDEFGKFPFELEMDTPVPDHECPVDCAETAADREPLSCDSECECDCEVCSCEEEGGDDEEPDMELEGEVEIEGYDSTEEHALPKVPKGYMPVIWGDCREHEDVKEKVEEEEDDGGSDFALDLWKML